MKIIVDTSVIIEFLRTGKGVYVDLMEKASKKSAVVYVPAVVVLELWKGQSMKNSETEKRVEKILLPMKSVDLTKQLAKKAGTIIRENNMDDFLDSVVAAAALYLDASVATLNKKHFTKIKGLKLL